jgi:hypothetical protein
MRTFKVIEKILGLSKSNEWEHAKKEWSLKHIYIAETSSTCLCGHHPIFELNGEEAIVGNCCVKKMTTLPSGKIFQAIKRIKKETGKSLNEEAIKYVYTSGFVSEWEYEFYLDTFRKKKLSIKQRAIRKTINKNVLIKVLKIN